MHSIVAVVHDKKKKHISGMAEHLNAPFFLLLLFKCNTIKSCTFKDSQSTKPQREFHLFICGHSCVAANSDGPSSSLHGVAGSWVEGRLGSGSCCCSSLTAAVPAERRKSERAKHPWSTGRQTQKGAKRVAVAQVYS